MCGIAGIVDKRGRLPRQHLAEQARAMADRMAYRGPDDTGVWVSPDGRCALSHRRLSIIDLTDGGHQPMLSQDRQRAIVFNGEIYNFQDLRAELEGKGSVFHSRSDTEVLLAAFADAGPAALPKLDAMFAFALYDTANAELLLARDVFGEKPLYYLETSDIFAFASELHALAVLPRFDAGVSREAIASYLAFQYVPGPATIYRSVKKLMPAHYLTSRPGTETRVRRYFEFKTSGAQGSNRTLDDLADELEAILVPTVKRRLISDVPLGAFLSGGVDSSTIAAIVTKKMDVPLQTFTIGFAGHPDSEHFDAAAIAKHLGTHHRQRVLEADAVDLGRHVGTVLDEPNADTSCLPTYLLSGFARETVTVALSGDGGDELFGGYARYFVTVDEWQQKCNGNRAFNSWAAGATYLSNRILVYPDDVLKDLVGEVPPGLAANLAAVREAIDIDPRPLIQVLREVDAANYMPGAVLAKVDRMSMQHSLEVRAPLIGLDVAKFAMRLAAGDCYVQGDGKRVLKKLAARYLPAHWMSRPKRGFGLPTDLWSANKLMPITRELVLGGDARLLAWIDRAALARYIDRLEGNFNAYRCWSLYILETWLRTHPAVPVGARSDRLRFASVFGSLARARDLLRLSAGRSLTRV